MNSELEKQWPQGAEAGPKGCMALLEQVMAVVIVSRSYLVFFSRFYNIINSESNPFKCFVLCPYTYNLHL